MKSKKLYLFGLTQQQLQNLATVLAQVSVSITKSDAHHIVIAARYDDYIQQVIDRCQEVVGKPLEVRSDHAHVRSTTQMY